MGCKNNIVDLIRNEARIHGNKVAVSTGDNDVTYKKLFRQIDEFKKFLIENFEVRRQSRIALFFDDSIEYIVASLAILDLGAILLPVSPLFSTKEFDSLCEKMEVNFVITSKKIEFLNVLNTKLFGHFVVSAIRKETKELIDNQEFGHPAFIRFSSGTTGKNKGVLLTHEAIYDRTEAANEKLGITCHDKIGWFLSMSYHFVVTILLFLRKGARIILVSKDFPQGLIRDFTKNSPTFLYASPLHFSLMAKLENLPTDLLSNVRMAVSTSMSLDRCTADDFKQKFNITLSQAYGIIEVGLPFINDCQNSDYIDSVGKILPAYQVHLDDKDEDGIGRILLKGKGMFSAYVSPWRTGDEWFDTGDLGEFVNGYLFIRGRKKNVINYNGMKIFPEEVEKVISNYKGVGDVKVYGCSHKLFGQIPVAELTTEQGDDEINISSLREFCRNHLDGYKVPKKFVKVENIEKTASGKIKR